MFVSPWAHLLDTVPPFPRPHTLFLRLSGHWVAGQWWWWWGGGAAFWASEAPSTSQLLGDTWVAPEPPGWALGRWGLLLCRLKETVGVWRVRRGASFCGRPGVAHAGAIPRFTPQPCTRALGTHSTASDKRRPGGPESRASLPAHRTGAEEGQGSGPPRGGSLGFLRLAEDGGSSHPLVVKGFREYPARVSLASSPPPSPS